MDTTGTGVFISHHSDSTVHLVKELSAVLTAFSIDHWYAERDIRPGDNYTQVIPEVIKQSHLVLLLLNREANASEQVLREVQYALKYKIPLLITKLDDSEESGSIAYIGSTAQYLDVRGLNTVVAAQTIGESIQRWQNKDKQPEIHHHFQTERAEVLLDFYGDEGERERLAIQHRFVYDFAAPHYTRFLTGLHDASFLDIGCNTAEQSMMFLQGRSEIAHYIGVDREKQALEHAAELYPFGHFYEGNCEADGFDALLTRIEDELGLEGFDIIHLSMLLLHMKKPQLLLDVLAEHLAEGGRMIILDVDDGLSFAYPDPDKLFKKAVDLCAETLYSGYRTSGRQIPQLLADVDLTDMELAAQGLSTVGMSREQRGDFFSLYFWIILDDLRKMCALDPKDTLAAAQLDWMEKHYKEMRSAFKKKGFFFNVGFMLYSAKRED